MQLLECKRFIVFSTLSFREIATRVLDLDRIIAWLRGEPVESNEKVTELTELLYFYRLKAGAPFISHGRLYRDPFQLFAPEKIPYKAAGWPNQGQNNQA